MPQFQRWPHYLLLAMGTSCLGLATAAATPPASKPTSRPTSRPAQARQGPRVGGRAASSHQKVPPRRRKAAHSPQSWRRLIGTQRRLLLHAIKRQKWRHATRIADRMTALFQGHYGRYHHKIALLHFRIGRVYLRHQRLPEADAQFDRSLHQITRVWSVPSVLLMGTIVRIQRDLHERLDNHRAVLQRRLTDDRWLHKNRPRDWRLGIWHSHMAALYDATEQSEAALKRRKQALHLIRKGLGSNNLLYVVGLMGLAQSQYNLGLLTASRKAVDQAIRIASRQRSPSGMILGRLHHRRALIDYLQKRFARSLREFRLARKWLLSSRHTRGVSLRTLDHNLALLHMATGRYSEAARLLQKALKASIARLGPAHPSQQTIYNSLALVAADQQRLTQATAYYQQALKLLSKSRQPKPLSRAILFMNLGSVLARQGRHREALRYARQARAIFAKKGRFFQRDLAQITQHIAHRYEDLGQLRAAVGHARAALKLVQTLPDPRPSLRVDVMLSLAQLQEKMGQRSASLRLMAQSWRMGWEQLSHQLMSMSRRQRAALLRYRVKTLGLYFSALWRWSRRAPNKQLAGLGLRWLLQSQSILSRLYQAQRDIIRHKSEARLQRTFRQIGLLSRRISQRAWQLSQRRRTTPTARKRWVRELQQLRRRKEALVQRLHLRLGERRYKPDKGRWQRLQPKLSRDAAMVAFVRYQRHRIEANIKPLQRWQEHRYMAFVLRAKGPPTMLDLGPTAPIDGAIRSYHRWLGRIPPRYLGGPRRAWGKLARHNKALLQTIWRPLQPHLKGVKKLWLIPDGALHLVPFGGLRLASGSFLTETLQISYLSSGLELRAAQHPKTSGNDALVMGAPSFGKGNAEITFVPLPKSASESQDVARRLKARPLLGQTATKAAFVAISQRGPQIIHLATHGFFMPLPAANSPGTRFPSMGLRSPLFRHTNARLVKAALTNPLRRAGLAFAGANVTPTAGILTAEEIESLDLRKTSLVVLSACDTGRGQHNIWQGVAGLRSAFLHAGARNLITSLWKIPDRETRLFMASFYRHLAASRAPQRAYHNAQRAMIARLRKRDGLAHPWYWSAFILQGPPGQLPSPTTRPASRPSTQPATRSSVK